MSANDETAAVCARVAKALTKKVPFVAPADLRHLLRCAEAWEWLARKNGNAAMPSHSIGAYLQGRDAWMMTHYLDSDAVPSVAYFPTPLAAVLSALDAKEGK